MFLLFLPPFFFSYIFFLMCFKIQDHFCVSVVLWFKHCQIIVVVVGTRPHPSIGNVILSLYSISLSLFYFSPLVAVAKIVVKVQLSPEESWTRVTEGCERWTRLVENCIPSYIRVADLHVDGWTSTKWKIISCIMNFRTDFFRLIMPSSMKSYICIGQGE